MVYTEEFIKDLKNQVDIKISFIVNKDYKNSIYGLGKNINLGDKSKFIEYSRILENILSCNDCYKDIKIDDVVSMIKNKLNEC